MPAAQHIGCVRTASTSKAAPYMARRRIKVKELQSRLQSSYQAARNNLVRHKERSKEYHDRNVNTPLFTTGDKDLLHDERVRRGRSAKLSSPWIGPYDIVDVDDVNVTLKLPRNRMLKVHANRLKPFF